MRILIVEDDELLATGLQRALTQSGYAVDWLNHGETADQMLADNAHDLLVLDIGLPGLDGLTVLKRLRGRGQTLPVMLLTARDDLSDKVKGLDFGADDYMVKPFELHEFEARIRALMRRAVGTKSAQIKCGDLVLDTASHRAWAKDVEIVFTAREWAIVEYLLIHQGQVLSKDKILQAVCNWDDNISLNAIEVYMSRLRSKLDPIGLSVRTIRGFGYLLEAQDDAVNH